MLQTNSHRVHRGGESTEGLNDCKHPFLTLTARRESMLRYSLCLIVFQKNINLSRSSSIIASRLVYLTQKEGDKLENGHFIWLFI